MYQDVKEAENKVEEKYQENLMQKELIFQVLVKTREDINKFNILDCPEFMKNLKDMINNFFYYNQPSVMFVYFEHRYLEDEKKIISKKIEDFFLNLQKSVADKSGIKKIRCKTISVSSSTIQVMIQ